MLGPLTQGSGQGRDAGDLSCSVPVVSFSHVSAVANLPVRQTLSSTKYPLAVCNDGSPATYLLRPGVGSGAKRWVIYLQGGGSCATADDCEKRYQQTPVYMSGATSTVGALPGIKSTDAGTNPDFWDATYVELQYCSSDLWSGDTAGNDALPTSDLRRWHWRGRRIVAAVIDDLKGHGLNDATEILFTGSSAGGAGATTHVDEVAALVPASARFVGMSDTSFVIDYPAFDAVTQAESTAMPTSKELIDICAVWGGGGDLSCEASGVADPRYCRSPGYVLQHGHLATPFFVRQSERDIVRLTQLFNGADAGTPGALAYRNRFAAEMRVELAALPAPMGVFSTADSHHGTIDDDTNWVKPVVNAVHLPEAFGQWYRDPCHSAVRLIAP